MKRKNHSLAWHTIKDMSKKLKIQRALIIVLVLILIALSVWFGISGGK